MGDPSPTTVTPVRSTTPCLAALDPVRCLRFNITGPAAALAAEGFPKGTWSPLGEDEALLAAVSRFPLCGNLGGASQENPRTLQGSTDGHLPLAGGEPDVATRACMAAPWGEPCRAIHSLHGRPLGRDMQSVMSTDGRPNGASQM